MGLIAHGVLGCWKQTALLDQGTANVWRKTYSSGWGRLETGFTFYSKKKEEGEEEEEEEDDE